METFFFQPKPVVRLYSFVHISLTDDEGMAGYVNAAMMEKC